MVIDTVSRGTGGSPDSIELRELDVHSRVSLNTISSWNWSIEQDVAFCRAVGVKTINPSLLKFDDEVQAGIAAIAAAGLRCCAASAGGAHVLIDGEDATLNALRGYIDQAAALGSPVVYGVAGPVPRRMPVDEAFDQLSASLPKAIGYARQNGVRLAIEHNSQASRDIGFVHSVADAVELAKRSGIGICMEIQNCWAERGIPELLHANIEHIALVQVSDFTFGEPLRFNRRVPGDGDIALDWLLGAVLDAGYQGFFDLEIVGPHIEGEGYASALSRSVEWMSDRLRRWGV